MGGGGCREEPHTEEGWRPGQEREGEEVMKRGGARWRRGGNNLGGMEKGGLEERREVEDPEGERRENGGPAEALTQESRRLL